jgi:hypothetical protein
MSDKKEDTMPPLKGNCLRKRRRFHFSDPSKNAKLLPHNHLESLQIAP